MNDSCTDLTPEVSFSRCGDYSSDLVNVLRNTFERIGGLSQFITRGMSVLIKPNLLTDRAPEEAVTTHPEIVRAIITLVREQGAHPIVGDSPASAVKLEQVWKKTGYTDMCKEEDVPLISFERTGSRTFKADRCTFSIARAVLDADAVINVPKIKTHMLTVLTAAVKNLYGTLPGYQKADHHKDHPDPSNFSKLLAEIYRQVPVTLNVADGIIGMEGAGPSGGDPVALGFVATSTSAVAMDMAICEILEINPEHVPYLRILAKSLPPESTPVLVGDSRPVSATTRFRTPGTFLVSMIPTWLVHLISPLIWIRPSITGRCVSCGRCVAACPSGALSMAGHTKPELSPSKCIGCCCCHEVCPEKAINISQSPLLNLIRRGKLP